MILIVIAPLATPVDVVVTTISGSLVTSVTKDADDTQREGGFKRSRNDSGK